jgi:hypothetical protein
MTRSTLCAALVVAALSVAPAAQASIPGPDGVIHGCYPNATGVLATLSVIDSAATCPPGQNPLLWNVTGPTGPTGLTGPAGPPGDPATGVLPESIQYQMTGTTVIYATGNGTGQQPTTRQKTLKLPLGNWAVTVHLEILDYSSCSLYGAGTGPTKTQDQMNGLTSPADEEDPNNLTLTTTVAETTGNELTLKCYSHNDHSLYVQLNSLVAIRVADVNEIPIPDGLPSTKKPPNFPSPSGIDLTHRVHAHLVNIYYSQHSPPHVRQKAQIALLAGEGLGVADIARQTFASEALVRAVIARYR